MKQLFFPIVVLLLVQVEAQYNKATTVINGNPFYVPQPSAAPQSSYAVASTPPAAQPTLIWNCQQMTSICTNVRTWLVQNGHSATLNGPMEFVYDISGSNAGRTNARRRSMCGPNSPWPRHNCPDTQNEVMSSLLGSLPAGVISGAVAPAGGQSPVKSQWIIPGLAANTPSGLVYTCDEFPCATWVQGGDGEKHNQRGSIICAASGIACYGSSSPNLIAARLAGLGKNKGEQDWQGAANNQLRNAMLRLYGRQALLGAFQFSTTTMAAPAAATTHAYIAIPNSNPINIKVKRSETTSTIDTSVPVFTEWHESFHYIVVGVPSSTAVLSVLDDTAPPLVLATNAPSSNLTWLLTPGNVENSTDLSARSPSEAKMYHERSVRRILQTRDGTLQNTSISEIAKAKQVVELAIKKQSEYNEFRFNNPRRNNMDADQVNLSRRDVDMAPPEFNQTVLDAAALLAELEAAGNITLQSLNASESAHQKRDGSYWLEQVNHNGLMAFNKNSSTYPVFRNVVKYGADPSGKTDSTSAINKAISDGYRCGAGCNSSSINGALVYFPSGTYLVSGTIISLYNTQLVGNANSRPTILAAASFVGLGVISSDVYVEGGQGGEWYINQNNFFRQIRNFIIDIRQVKASYPAGIHWQVAQATSIENVDFVSSTGDTTQQGIFAENGSGGFMTGLTFTGGNFGIYGGNQQFTVRNAIFSGCKTGIGLIWDWGWTWKDLQFQSCGTGMSMIGEGNTRQTGSIYLLDSQCTNTQVCILSSTPLAGPPKGTTYITLDNFAIKDCATAIKDQNGNTILAGGTTTYNSWALGKVYNSASPKGTYTPGSTISPVRPLEASLRRSDGSVYTRGKPRYLNYGPASVINIKSCSGAKGDGNTDDTASINKCLQQYSGQDVIIFFPQGSYIVTDTITIPKGSKIVGEVWSQIMATGSKFQDMKNPHVMFKVGNVGDVGSMEIQDMLFTVKGPTAGAVLVEWNIQASSQGAAGMWDCHFRVGGALGSGLGIAQCPRSTGPAKTACIAASMLLHVTAQSSAYLENVWAWTADHDMDDPMNTQIDVYAARGILIESQGPTWLWGTAAEHNMLYQYELHKAKDVYMGMIQTESPYYYPQVQAPAPFNDALGLFNADPDFTNCQNGDGRCTESWALRIVSSDSIFVAGAGLYAWFYDKYSQACVDTQNCQRSMVSTYLSSHLWLYNIITIGAVEMLSPYGTDNTPALATDNTDSTGHPYWSIINAWLLQSGNSDQSYSAGQTVSVASWVWDVPSLTVSCWYPCVIQLPPITLPAIQAPLITTMIGTFTRTVTPPVYNQAAITPQPITVSAKPTATNAASTITASISFNQTGLVYPSFDFVDPSSSSDKHNISGIVVPFPLKYGSPPDRSAGDCWFLCNWPPALPPILISNGSPWPRVNDPEPPGLSDDPDDASDDGSDEDQPQEPPSTSGAPTTGPTRASTTAPTSTITSEAEKEDDDCTAVPTILVRTNGVSLASGGWASAYPTISFHPIFGSNLAIFGAYTPIVAQSQYVTDNGAAQTTVVTRSTSTAASAKPTSSSPGGYFYVLTGEPTPDLTEQTDYWLGYDDKDRSGFDLCTTTDRVLSVAYTGFNPSKPLYPESLPAISLGTHDNCTFRWKSSDSTHAMYCTDGKTFICDEYGDSGHGFTCNGGNGGFKTVYPKLRCPYI